MKNILNYKKLSQLKMQNFMLIRLINTNYNFLIERFIKKWCYF